MMKKLRTSAMISLALGVLSALGILLSLLALTDIGHGAEPSLEAEWTMVQIGYALAGLFHVSVFVTLAWVLKLVTVGFRGG